MFNLSEFLKLAEELGLAAQDEAKIRTAVCRAYYYAFLFSREWLRTKSMIFHDDGRDHGVAVRGLRQHVDFTTGSMLWSLHNTYRGEADYNLTVNVLQTKSNEAIELAKKIVANIAAKTQQQSAAPNQTPPSTQP